MEKIIMILSGGLKKDENGRWRTTNYDEPESEFSVPGDALRIIAASYLYHDNPNSLIIVAGGKGLLRKNPDAPILSKVLKDELIEHGVPAEKIIEEGSSGTTYQQLIELKSGIDSLDTDNCSIISNDWHLPRIKAMLEYNPILREMYKGIKIELISAENIVLEKDVDKWQSIIEIGQSTAGMIERIKQEIKGTQEIKDGTYQYH